MQTSCTLDYSKAVSRKRFGTLTVILFTRALSDLQMGKVTGDTMEAAHENPSCCAKQERMRVSPGETAVPTALQRANRKRRRETLLHSTADILNKSSTSLKT